MFIDRCLVCLSTPFENYFIIHLSYFIIMSNYVFFFFLTLGTCFSMFVYICNNGNPEFGILACALESVIKLKLSDWNLESKFH